MKRIFIIGSGGREHALAWKLSQSRNVEKIFVAPGNAGTCQLATNISIPVSDISRLAEFAKNNAVDLTIVGPDEALSKGIVDYFQAKGLKIFGPTKRAAEIEWSKKYAKKLMKKCGIPTAGYTVFPSCEIALQHIQEFIFPAVVKANGLAFGKGVFICRNQDEARAALLGINELSSPNKSVIIEEYLEGEEVSAHAICDGNSFILFPLARDHKRIGEGNSGKNTGGMGTICPVSGPLEEIGEIITKVLSALKSEGREFSGCLFPGVILTKNGPKVLEFNARFGDPETQVFMRLLNTDLLEVLEAAVEKKINTINLKWKKEVATSIVLASAGYPDNYNTGYEIKGIGNLSSRKTVLFHAGTLVKENKVFTNGGRVLNVTSTGSDLGEALETAYKAVKTISFQGKTFRKDIGK